MVVPHFHSCESQGSSSSWKLRPALSAEPSIQVRKLKSNDLFLIFASDSLWENLSDDAAIQIVLKQDGSSLHCGTDKAEKLIAEAAGYGSQLVLFPEVFVGGCPHGSTFGLVGNRSAKGMEDFRKYHEAAIDVPGPEVSRLAALAGKYKVFLVIGVVERAGYTLYNIMLSFDPLGKYLGKHRKLMPTSLERVFWGFGVGSTIPVYDTPLGKIGSAICWENRMPLLTTVMYAKDVEIYCAPTVDCMPTWQPSMTHIALEGGCFVLSAVPFTGRKDYPPPPDYICWWFRGRAIPRICYMFWRKCYHFTVWNSVSRSQLRR